MNFSGVWLLTPCKRLNPCIRRGAVSPSCCCSSMLVPQWALCCIERNYLLTSCVQQESFKSCSISDHTNEWWIIVRTKLVICAVHFNLFHRLICLPVHDYMIVPSIDWIVRRASSEFWLSCHLQSIFWPILLLGRSKQSPRHDLNPIIEFHYWSTLKAHFFNLSLFPTLLISFHDRLKTCETEWGCTPD